MWVSGFRVSGSRDVGVGIKALRAWLSEYTWRFMGSYKGSFKGPFKGFYRGSLRVWGLGPTWRFMGS